MKAITSRGLFLLISSLLVCCILAFNYIGELRQQEEQIRGAVKDLHAGEDELYKRIKEVTKTLEEAEAKNKELKEMLELRYSNYLIASRLEATDMPLLKRSGFSPDMFERAWEELGADRLQGSGEEFVRAEESTGVNALVLAAICVHETNWGESDLARYKNNYFGWGAYDFSPYESAVHFDSREDSIKQAAESLKRDYLSREGRFYRGEDLRSVNKMYAQDEEWANKVADVMRTIAKNAMEDSEEVEEYLLQYETPLKRLHN